MRKFFEKRRSRREKRILDWMDKRTNIENPPIQHEVELLNNHTIWREGKNRGTYGQGPLYELTETEARHFIDKAKEASRKVGGFPGIDPEDEDPENLPETGEEPTGNHVRGYPGLTVYRVGEALPFIAPKFMSTSFITQGRWEHTVKGMKQNRRTIIFLVLLSYLFLLYYLPQRRETSDWDLITSRFAIMIYCIAGASIYWNRKYSLRATASRIRMQCFNPDLCDLAGVHVGTFVCPRYPPSVQIKWWTGYDPALIVKGLNNAMGEKIADYRKQIASLKGQLKAKEFLARIEAHDYFSRQGFLYRDDEEIQKPKKALAFFFVLSIVLGTILVILLMLMFMASRG